MREQIPDASAETERAQAALRKADVRRNKDALRKRRARKEQKLPEGKKPSAADAPVRPSADASTDGDGPLSDLVNEPAAAPSAADMQTAAAAIAKQLDAPEKLAALLAHLQVAAQEKVGKKHPRVARVIGALDLADDKGSRASGASWRSASPGRGGRPTASSSSRPSTRRRRPWSASGCW